VQTPLDSGAMEDHWIFKTATLVWKSIPASLLPSGGSAPVGNVRGCRWLQSQHLDVFTGHEYIGQRSFAFYGPTVWSGTVCHLLNKFGRRLKWYLRYDTCTADVTTGLRGHSMKVFKPRCRTTVRQHFFSLRIVNEWNKLPQTVIEATSVNAFKNRLDRHWSDMGVYSWLATQPINNKYK